MLQKNYNFAAMFENKKTSDAGNLGEFGLINHIKEHITTNHSNTVKGIGDDAAIIKIGNEYILQSSDIYTENVDFDVTFHPLKHLGYKMIVGCISDILAMNAIPTHVLINIAFSSKYTLEAVEELYAGFILAAEAYHIDIVGGDISNSTNGLTVSLTSTGSCKSIDTISYRKGAKYNDLLVVTGDIGGAYMGLQILEREKSVFLEHPNMQPDLEPYEYIVGKQLRPLARLDAIQSLADLKVVPTSMIDISDGIASELYHLAKASKVGFNVYENKLPIDPQTLQTALDFDLNPSVVALNGGEDYELLFTIDQADFEKIKNQMDFTVIGHVTDSVESIQLVTVNNQSFKITAQGHLE